MKKSDAKPAKRKNKLIISQWLAEARRIKHQNLPEALRLTQEAHSLAVRARMQEATGDCLSLMGECYVWLGNHKDGLAQIFSALSCFKALGLSSKVARTYMVLGAAYYLSSDYTTALDYFLEALEQRADLPDKTSEAYLLTNLGVTFGLLGELDKSLEFQLESLEKKRDLNDPYGEAVSLGNIGNLYIRLDDFEQGLTYHQEAQAMFHRLQKQLEEANALGNIGACYFKLGHFEKALKSYQTGFAIAKTVGAKSIEHFLLNGIAIAYNRLGNSAVAEKFYQKTVRSAKRASDVNMQAEALHELGKLVLQHAPRERKIETHHKRIKKAIEFFHESLNLSVSTSNKE
jgi:tetratricopeptide (TPR) repeat protein